MIFSALSRSKIIDFQDSVKRRPYYYHFKSSRNAWDQQGLPTFRGNSKWLVMSFVYDAETTQPSCTKGYRMQSPQNSPGNHSVLQA